MLKGAEGVDQGCPEGAQGVHEGCKGILGFCMRNATGCAKGAVRTADTLALQDQFDHSCVTEGHLQHELDAKLAQAMAPVSHTCIEPRGSDVVRSFVKAKASDRFVG